MKQKGNKETEREKTESVIINLNFFFFFSTNFGRSPFKFDDRNLLFKAY